MNGTSTPYVLVRAMPERRKSACAPAEPRDGGELAWNTRIRARSHRREPGPAPGEMVELTVVHDGFDPGIAILPNVSQGWPRILSGLKTLLETGDILPVGKGRVGQYEPRRRS
jgi:hypothetical protein